MFRHFPLIVLLFAAPFAFGATECEDGTAGDYPCHLVKLKTHFSADELTPGNGPADKILGVWGWERDVNRFRYLLVGRSSGTTVVRPDSTNIVGYLPTAGDGTGDRREIKTYSHYAFIVANIKNHGMQVLDLKKVMASRTKNLSAAAHYTGFGSAKGIAIDEQSGFAYILGADKFDGAPIFIDLSDPLHPKYAGHAADAKGARGAQCIRYYGPDPVYKDHQICFFTGGGGLTIIDVTQKRQPVLVSQVSYPKAVSAYQGWLTDNGHYFALSDDGDEQKFGGRTRTMIFDVSRLAAPKLVTQYKGTTHAIDHGLHINGPHIYESNYTSGLRIINIRDIEHPLETNYFDTHPEDNETAPHGASSNYPFTGNGLVAVTDTENGLFVLKPHLLLPDDGTIDLALSESGGGYDMTPGTRFGVVFDIVSNTAAPAHNVVLQAPIPTDIKNPAANASQGSCDIKGGNLVCRFGKIAGGSSAEARLLVTPTACGNYKFPGSVSSDRPDPDTSDNRAKLTVGIGRGVSGTLPCERKHESKNTIDDSGGGGSFGPLMLLLLCVPLLARGRQRRR
jgi:choice-of-anchor B domain-containing protein